MLLTHAQLRKLVRYDPLTGVFTARTARGARYPIGRRLDYPTSSGKYRAVYLLEITYQAHELAWFYVYGIWRWRLDHKNRNGTDNRIANLRMATASQNSANREKSSNNTSGYKGVSWDKKTNKWTAAIGCQYQTFYLGRFDNPEVAHQHYFAAAQKLFGEFACA